MHFQRRRLFFEALESRRVLSGVEGEVEVFVNIPDNLTGSPGEVVTAPVNIDNAAGVRGAEIRIAYDTTKLDADEGSVLIGDVWTQNATDIVVNVNDATGSIIAWVFAAEELPAMNGSLVEVRFAIRNDVAVGDTIALDLTRVRLNEGDIQPDPAPVPGPDSTDGRITVVGAQDTASISGFVYADTNTNNRPDPFEGIPRVRIVLVPTAGGPQRETFTDDDGSYEFRDLAPGSYRIEQRQPAAFLDGGPNEISVQLAAGQTLGDQNFRERGLRPEYVYNRLFTTLVQPVGSTSWVGAVRGIVDDAENAAAASAAVSALSLASNAVSQLSASPDGANVAASEPSAASESEVAEGEPSPTAFTVGELAMPTPVTTSVPELLDAVGDAPPSNAGGSRSAEPLAAESEAEVVVVEMPVKQDGEGISAVVEPSPAPAALAEFKLLAEASLPAPQDVVGPGSSWALAVEVGPSPLGGGDETAGEESPPAWSVAWVLAEAPASAEAAADFENDSTEDDFFPTEPAWARVAALIADTPNDGTGFREPFFSAREDQELAAIDDAFDADLDWLLAM